MLEINGSALTSERQRAEVVTSNMANVETTRTPQGGPYRRQLVVFQSQKFPQFPLMLTGGLPSTARGVRVSQVVADPEPPIERYQPGNPDADAKGYVAYPAIDPVAETTDLLGAVRSYELNASAVQATKTMIQQTLDLLR